MSEIAINSSGETQGKMVVKFRITSKAKGMLHPQEVLAAIYRHSIQPTDVSTVAVASGVEVRIMTEESSTIVSLLGETDFSNAGMVDTWVCSYGCRTCG